MVPSMCKSQQNHIIWWMFNIRVKGLLYSHSISPWYHHCPIKSHETPLNHHSIAWNGIKTPLKSHESSCTTPSSGSGGGSRFHGTAASECWKRCAARCRCAAEGFDGSGGAEWWDHDVTSIECIQSCVLYIYTIYIYIHTYIHIEHGWDRFWQDVGCLYQGNAGPHRGWCQAPTEAPAAAAMLLLCMGNRLDIGWPVKRKSLPNSRNVKHLGHHA